MLSPLIKFVDKSIHFAVDELFLTFSLLHVDPSCKTFFIPVTISFSLTCDANHILNYG